MADRSIVTTIEELTVGSQKKNRCDNIDTTATNLPLPREFNHSAITRSL